MGMSGKETYDEICHLLGTITRRRSLHGDLKMNRNYYIKQIRDLSKNYDSDAQSKILDELTDKFFDVDGIKELYDILMEEVYGDGGIKGYLLTMKTFVEN